MIQNEDRSFRGRFSIYLVLGEEKRRKRPRILFKRNYSNAEGTYTARSNQGYRFHRELSVQEVQE